jgi:hypothetical protein
MELTEQRHHYVPEFYQRGFIEDGSGLIWVYEKGRTPRQLSVKKRVGFELNLYAFTNRDGGVDVESIEKSLADIDREAARVIRKIDSGAGISAEDRQSLCTFIGVMWRRTPEHRRKVGDMATKTMPEVFANIEAEIFSPGFDVKQYLNEDQQKRLEQRYAEFLQIKREYSAKHPDFLFPSLIIRNSILQMMLEGMDWAFFKSTRDTPYLTCDDPVVFNLSPQHQQGGVLFFPLSKDTLLQAMRVSSYRGGYQQLTNTQVRELNRHIVRNAKNQVYAGRTSKVLAGFVEKWLGKGR